MRRIEDFHTSTYIVPQPDTWHLVTTRHHISRVLRGAIRDVVKLAAGKCKTETGIDHTSVVTRIGNLFDLATAGSRQATALPLSCLIRWKTFKKLILASRQLPDRGRQRSYHCRARSSINQEVKAETSRRYRPGRGQELPGLWCS